MSSFKLHTKVRQAVEQDCSISQVVQEFWSAYTSVVYPAVPYFQNLLLCCATHNKRLDLVTALLGDHFPIHYSSGYGGMCPVHIACKHGQKEMIAVLLESGGDVNIKASGDVDYTGQVATAVEHLLSHDDVCLMKFIMDKYDPRKNNGQTLLHVACQANANKCAEYLLENGLCDVNVTDYRGQTSLSVAATTSVELVHLLLSYDASVATLRVPCIHLATEPYSYANPHYLPADTHLTVEALLQHGEYANYVSPNSGRNLLTSLLHQIRLTIQQNLIDGSRRQKCHQTVLRTIHILLQSDFIVDWNYIGPFMISEIQELAHRLDQKKYSSPEMITAAFQSVIDAMSLVQDVISLLLLQHMSSFLDNHTTSLVLQNMASDKCVQFSDIDYSLQSEYVSTASLFYEVMTWCAADWSILVNMMVDTLVLMISHMGIHVHPLNICNTVILNLPLFKPLLNIILDYSDHQTHNKYITILKDIIQDINIEDHSYIDHISKHPRTLKQTSKMVIFNSLQHPKYAMVRKLQLPTSIQNQVVPVTHITI